MAKSNLDLAGAKGPKLELDFLRLVYAAKELQRAGDTCYSYLCVMTPEIAQRVQTWAGKYGAIGLVEVIVPSEGSLNRNRLAEEKKRNIEGMIDGTVGNTSAGKSDASYGRDVGEDFLRATALNAHPSVAEITAKSDFPFSINWDFYGQEDT